MFTASCKERLSHYIRQNWNGVVSADFEKTTRLRVLIQFAFLRLPRARLGLHPRNELRELKLWNTPIGESVTLGVGISVGNADYCNNSPRAKTKTKYFGKYILDTINKWIISYSHESRDFWLLKIT